MKKLLRINVGIAENEQREKAYLEQKEINAVDENEQKIKEHIIRWLSASPLTHRLLSPSPKTENKLSK